MLALLLVLMQVRSVQLLPVLHLLLFCVMVPALANVMAVLVHLRQLVLTGRLVAVMLMAVALPLTPVALLDMPLPAHMPPALRFL
jgi:hypothetical protein